MVNRLRKTFMKAVMRQDITWFDAKSTGTLTTELFRFLQVFKKISCFSNVEKFKNGTGDHIGYSVHTLSMFISGFAICFYYDWRLTAIGTCLTPFIALWGYWDNNVSFQRDRKTERQREGNAERQRDRESKI